MALKQFSFSDNKQLKIILSLGILLRVIVFIFQAPLNNDKHFQVIYYIYHNYAIPLSNQFDQSYHCPLYYLLSSLFLYLGNVKTVQLLSLCISIFTLIVFYWLINNVPYIRSKKWCLSLACFLPQFILYGNFISNDTLSFLTGGLIFLQLFNYCNRPTRSNQNLLALFLGLGLLTKGTFIVFIPILLGLVVILNYRDKISLKRLTLNFLLFSIIVLSIGSYKFVENAIYLGRPFVHNLDPNPRWADSQRPTYRGPSSFYDVNVIKLIRHPTISPQTKHSYPLMLYGTFWYQYIPESIYNTKIPLWSTFFFDTSSFQGNPSKYTYVGSLIYVFALIPTFLFMVGFFRIVLLILNYIKKSSENNFNKIIYSSTCVLLFLANLALIVYAGIKYDVWSCFQSRLLFPSLFVFLLLFDDGLDYILKYFKKAQIWIYGSLTCLTLLFSAYFSLEIGNIVLKYL